MIACLGVAGTRARANQGCVEIRASVYHDTNSNGQLESGEPLLGGIVVKLLDANKQTLTSGSSTTTNGGEVKFTNLLPAVYYLQVQVPSGYTPTNALPGNDATKVDKITIKVDATTGDMLYCGNKFLFCKPNPKVHIAGKVYVDLDCDGVLDSGEPAKEGVEVKLFKEDYTYVKNTFTSSTGDYLFSYLTPGTYLVRVVEPTGYVASNAIVRTAGTKLTNFRVKVPATEAGKTYYVDFLLCKHEPKVKITKLADKSVVQIGDKVTYTYSVTNTGNILLKNIKVVDDNGTPDYKADDFTVGTIDSLAPGANQTLSATVYPPITLCSSPGVISGQIITQQASDGNIQVTFNQSTSVNDNTYGVNSVGWQPKRPHTFKDLLNSDQATFSFTDSANKEILRFQLDYLAATTQAVFPSGTVQYPSGYGTLGVKGGDGKMLKGDANSVLFATTSLTTNLNQSPDYYKVIVDSPAPGTPLAAKWDNVMRYKVIVDKLAFGSAGFGKVAIISQHNSPSKIGTFVPTPCESQVTNTVVVTASSEDGQTVTSSAKATVTVKP
jgi:hypothetical protein